MDNTKIIVVEDMLKGLRCLYIFSLDVLIVRDMEDVEKELAIIKKTG